MVLPTKSKVTQKVMDVIDNLSLSKEGVDKVKNIVNKMKSSHPSEIKKHVVDLYNTMITYGVDLKGENELSSYKFSGLLQDLMGFVKSS